MVMLDETRAREELSSMGNCAVVEAYRTIEVWLWLLNSAAVEMEERKILCGSEACERSILKEMEDENAAAVRSHVHMRAIALIQREQSVRSVIIDLSQREREDLSHTARQSFDGAMNSALRTAFRHQLNFRRRIEAESLAAHELLFWQWREELQSRRAAVLQHRARCLIGTTSCSPVRVDVDGCPVRPSDGRSVFVVESASSPSSFVEEKSRGAIFAETEGLSVVSFEVSHRSLIQIEEALSWQVVRDVASEGCCICAILEEERRRRLHLNEEQVCRRNGVLTLYSDDSSRNMKQTISLSRVPHPPRNGTHVARCSTRDLQDLLDHESVSRELITAAEFEEHLSLSDLLITLAIFHLKRKQPLPHPPPPKESSNRFPTKVQPLVRW
jgi:hypothetical protein